MLRISSVDVSEAAWQKALGVNFMQHAHVAKHLVPRYLARGTFCSARELEVHFATEAKRRVARRVLVDIYASMSVEELVCGVPHDFQAEPGQRQSKQSPMI